MFVFSPNDITISISERRNKEKLSRFIFKGHRTRIIDEKAGISRRKRNIELNIYFNDIYLSFSLCLFHRRIFDDTRSIFAENNWSIDLKRRNRTILGPKNGPLVYLPSWPVVVAVISRANAKFCVRDAVTAVEDTWRVNIRGVGSLKKRGTSSGPRSFVKSSPACSLFESLIKEVAVSRLIFYAPSSTFTRSLSLSLFSLFLFLFIETYVILRMKISKIYLRLLLRYIRIFFYYRNEFERFVPSLNFLDENEKNVVSYSCLNYN